MILDTGIGFIFIGDLALYLTILVIYVSTLKASTQHTEIYLKTRPVVQLTNQFLHTFDIFAAVFKVVK